MTSIETILSNFYFEEIEKPGFKYPKFGKAGRKDYLFTCKRCGSQSEPMKFDHDLRYRLGVHLASNCHPLSTITNNSNNTSEEEAAEGRDE
jgi:hypothetical protein